MARGVADTEMIRRQNRALVLAALRRHGPMSRSRIATLTGLSNASLTAIGSELVAQGVLSEIDEPGPETRARGRPAILVTHNRQAAYVILIELDVTRCRLSLLDYGGVLVDRVETGVEPDLFGRTQVNLYLLDRVALMLTRNPEAAGRLRNVSLSVQGILDPPHRGLQWSPIPHVAGHDLAGPIERAHGVPTHIYKRGHLMADGVHRLYPDFARTNIATIFIGSTIGMGLSFASDDDMGEDMGTEFGHMNHIPDGALCRCGARGCIEAYAADYGILRTAYSVPEQTTPAQAVPLTDYNHLVSRARVGYRDARYAFTLAGKALGFGLSRLMSVIGIGHIVLLGHGTAAFDLMRASIEDAVATSLMGRVSGLPPVTLVEDAGEPIFKGLTMKALTELDRNHFALTGAEADRSEADQVRLHRPAHGAS